jgi:primosomal replication protein N
MTARIVERGALRFTPAGLPALDVSLRHESSISQPDSVRKLAFEIRGRAVGAVTDALGKAELGVEHDFQGFLGSQRNGRGIVFHIQTIEFKQRGQHHAPAPR